jgi:hypothetical protein
LPDFGDGDAFVYFIPFGALVWFELATGDIPHHEPGETIAGSTPPFVLLVREKTRRGSPEGDFVAVVSDADVGASDLVVNGDLPTILVVEPTVGVVAAVPENLADILQGDTILLDLVHDLLFVFFIEGAVEFCHDGNSWNCQMMTRSTSGGV